MNRKNIIVALAVLIVAILAIVGLSSHKSNNNTGVNSAIENRDDALQESESHRYEATVSITSTGFVPAKITVKKDTRVYFENHDTTGGTHSVVADAASLKVEPMLGLNDDTKQQSSIGPDSGYAFSFHKTGTFKVHDGSNPSYTAEVDVK